MWKLARFGLLIVFVQKSGEEHTNASTRHNIHESKSLCLFSAKFNIQKFCGYPRKAGEYNKQNNKNMRRLNRIMQWLKYFIYTKQKNQILMKIFLFCKQVIEPRIYVIL